MKKSEIAKEKFQCFNCCQSVLFPFCEELGLPEKKALLLASGFGSGMRRGATCGAVTGAYMVLGLKNSPGASISETKAKINSMVKEFNARFIERHGSLVCKELIGYDVSIPEEAEKASSEDVYNTICPKFVASAVEIIELEF